MCAPALFRRLVQVLREVFQRRYLSFVSFNFYYLSCSLLASLKVLFMLCFETCSIHLVKLQVFDSGKSLGHSFVFTGAENFPRLRRR